MPGVFVSPGNGFRWPALISDLAVLTKLRVNLLVAATAFVGYALHAPILPNWLSLLVTLAGTGLIAAAAAATNQAIEQEFDRCMERTRNRPLAAGRLRRANALWIAALLLGGGLLCLGVVAGWLATGLAVLTFAIYSFAYTPLKRRTPICIAVGAVAGALPVLVGWAASGKAWNSWTIVATGTLFLWQFPHFLAIAWWRKSEYANAGFRVLGQNDRTGLRASGWCVLFSVVMVVITILPAAMHQVPAWYLVGGLALGVLMTGCSVRFLKQRSEAAARRLFTASLVYLPGVYFIMLVARYRA